MIGGSAYADDGTFTGNIYDFRIYNKAITNADVARSTALMNTQSADEALNSFEKMMNSGTIYMNMAPAYDAYVALKKQTMSTSMVCLVRCQKQNLKIIKPTWL